MVFEKACSIIPLWIIFTLFLKVIECGYSKVQYLPVYSKITAIVNCKIQSNAIYTTQQGIIYHWESYEKVTSASLQGQSPTHQLVCSKYGEKLNNAYIGVLDSSGRINIFQEKIGTFTNEIQALAFTPSRFGQISEISIGNDKLGILYRTNQSHIIDVYELPNHGFQTFSLEPSILTIKIDSLGNLAYLSLKDNQLFFNYCQSPRTSINCLTKSIPSFQQSPISIDYWQQENSPSQIRFRFLLSTPLSAGNIYYSSVSGLSAFFSGRSTPNVQQICDGSTTFVSQNNYGITKDGDGGGEIFVIGQPISMFACTTDTGSYVYSQFYVVSYFDGTSFIDCYYDVNEVLNFLIGAGVFCCCFCLRICASCNQGGCRLLGAILYGLYYVLLWCPTRDNVEEIQDSLEK